jgi:hypothetical protein
MRCLLISLCVGLALWMVISCVDSPPFRLASFMQDGRHDVRLNERLILTFTHEVDRSSLSPAAARIIDDSGLPAEGKWEVRGKEVHFLPRLPRHADGSDAGLSPGRPYRVEFAGFPAVSALRSTGGLLLAQAFSRSFNTVSTDVEELDRFVDPAPESGPALVGPSLFPSRSILPRYSEEIPSCISSIWRGRWIWTPIRSIWNAGRGKIFAR